MNNSYDLIVVGAGSIGVPAALEFAKNGQSVLVIDELASPGQGIRLIDQNVKPNDPQNPLLGVVSSGDQPKTKSTISESARLGFDNGFGVSGLSSSRLRA